MKRIVDNSPGTIDSPRKSRTSSPRRAPRARETGETDREEEIVGIQLRGGALKATPRSRGVAFFVATRTLSRPVRSRTESSSVKVAASGALGARRKRAPRP